MSQHETIICAWCEYASGPGWANAPVWIIVQDGDGKLRRECVQPDKQGKLLHQIYPLCAEMHSLLLRALEGQSCASSQK